MWTDTQGMQPHPVPEAMSAADIENAIREYTRSAQNAIEAGFDGVEIHAANGYLPEQFLNPHANIRTDEYGGSIANRIRFVLEVTASIARAIGKEKTGIRISPYSTFNDMPQYDDVFGTYETLAQELDRLDILYVHLVESEARDREEGGRLAAAIRKQFTNAVIVNGGYTPKNAGEALESGRADLVSFGAPFISNPDFPVRIKHNYPLAEPDAGTFYTPGKEGYTDYPFHNETTKP
jgi:N-ethylmaleimide reductase